MHMLMHHPLVEKLRSSGSRGVGLAVLRLMVGIAFISHGMMKLNGLEGAVRFFASRGIPMAEFMAPFVSTVEVVGGILLILGLVARFAGLALAFDMAVAVLTGLAKPTWQAHELELILFGSAVMFLLHGAGKFSLDAVLMKKGMKEHDHAMPVIEKAK